MKEDAELAIRRGKRAQKLLNDPLMVEIFTALKQAYFNSCVQSRTPAEREEVWARAIVLDDVQAGMLAIVSTGELLEARRKKAEGQ